MSLAKSDEQNLSIFQAFHNHDVSLIPTQEDDEGKSETKDTSVVSENVSFLS